MFDGPTARSKVCGFPTHDFLEEDGVEAVRRKTPEVVVVAKPEAPKRKSILKYTRLKRA